MRAWIPVALAVANAAGAQAPAAPPSDSALTARVNQYLSRIADRGYAGGVLVRRSGRTLLARSYGLANREAGIRADANTVYNIGSITKQFTAAAILRLEELGKLRTTDSIARFFPKAPADKRAITLHQLLTHTAGFESDYSPGDYEPNTRDEYVGRMFAKPLRTPPGAAHHYANSGYSMLAAIVEIVTGKDYESALRELVLLPAGMRETGYAAPHWAPNRVAHGYQARRDWGTIVERIAVPGAPFWALRGNGGLHTTLADMAHWDDALNDRRMLTDSSRRKFMTGYVNEGPDGRSQYAYGWAVMRTPRGTRLVTHNGGNGVYVAELLRYVDEGVTIFLTSTVAEQPASPVVNVLARIAFGTPYELPPERAAAAPADIAALTGAFTLRDGSRLTLRADGARLTAEAVGQQAFQFLSAGDTTSPPDASTLNARALAAAQGAVRGDIRALRVALGPGAPDSASVAQQEAEMMQGRLGRFGEFRSVEVLGTSRGPGGMRRTTVRLNFARGGATNVYVWGPDGFIEDIEARPYAPSELVPTGPGEFRAMDPRTGGSATIRVRDGAVALQAPSGAVTVTRVP
jgi:CubicO group peptidase (beta-lactamase class C family)